MKCCKLYHDLMDSMHGSVYGKSQSKQISCDINSTLEYSELSLETVTECTFLGQFVLRQWQEASSKFVIQVFRSQLVVFETKYIYLIIGCVWCYQGGEYENFSLLGCYALESEKKLQTIRGCILWSLKKFTDLSGLHATSTIWADIGDRQISPKSSCIFTRQRGDTTRHHSWKRIVPSVLMQSIERRLFFCRCAYKEKKSHNSVLKFLVAKRCWENTKIRYFHKLGSAGGNLGKCRKLFWISCQIQGNIYRAIQVQDKFGWYYRSKALQSWAK
jgi:hypothetical protein